MRIAALGPFRKQEVDILLCTDLASQGLDIHGIDTVINYEAPASYKIYLHRVGRTARAGCLGWAVTFTGEPDCKIVKIALKVVKESGKILSCVLPPEVVSAVGKKLDELEDVVEEVLNDETEEKAMRIAEGGKKGGKCDEISGGNYGLAKEELVCDGAGAGCF